MSKIFFYVILSTVMIFVFYFLQKATNYSEEENIVPKEVRLMILGAELPERSTDDKHDVFIIGSSHVRTGFNGCNNRIITRHFSGIRGAKSIRIANSIMFSSFLEDIEKINLILEVSLIEEMSVSQQQKNSIIYKYISDTVPIFSDAVNMNRYEKNDGCSELSFDNNYRMELGFSRDLKEQLIDLDISYLFSQYKYHLDKLVSVCNNTKNARITLVSLPIHSDLYAFPKVRNTFTALDSEMFAYFDSIQGKNSCDISYINLVELGAEFPEQKFWVDPGHFRPEVGDRVLQEIELFHANKKTH